MRDCEAIKKSLGAWLDGELDAAQAAEIQLHVQGCASCSDEKGRLERLDFSLKRLLETNASQIDFKTFWAGVSQRIAADVSWSTRAMDWVRAVFFTPRLKWAVSATVVVLVAVLSLDQFFPGWRGNGQTNMASVESIDGHGFNVALLREAKTKTTVIWLFENQESEDETPTESASGDTAF
ncbi:MAG TPA: zf-HC2 domain-containing protein [Candidatus Binatia bacterium]|jgi:anti-sigma factor RsiW